MYNPDHLDHDDEDGDGHADDGTDGGEDVSAGGEGVPEGRVLSVRREWLVEVRVLLWQEGDSSLAEISTLSSEPIDYVLVALFIPMGFLFPFNLSLYFSISSSC